MLPAAALNTLSAPSSLLAAAGSCAESRGAPGGGGVENSLAVRASTSHIQELLPIIARELPATARPSATHETVDNGSEIMERSQRKSAKKKRSLLESGLVDSEKNVDDALKSEAMNSYNMEEPTMEEKLASLDLRDGSKMTKPLDDKNLEDQLPSADSIGVLLQQALNADDRALLLECLYTQDEKVIRKSLILLNPSQVLKLLTCIASVIQSRGAVVACTVPWLKSLILHHSSSLMSQNSSLRSLNSISQLIESRTSNFESALKLTTCLDLLEISDDAGADISMKPAVVYEDKDDSDGELTDATETDEDGEGEE